MGYYKGKKVLVTGGCGFIGSHLAERLVELGAKVTIVDNLERGLLDNISSVENRCELGTIIDLRRDYLNKFLGLDLYENMFEGQDMVFHLAFKVGGVIYTSGKPFFSEIWSDGTRINLNVIDACCKWKIPKLLFVSSACVYSSELQKYGCDPLQEEESTIFQPSDAYGWSKLVGELQTKWAYQNELLEEAVILRPFNVYGEREYYDRDHGHALPVLCRKAIEYPELPFTVHGDGKNIRCFLYVSDMVDALVNAMEKVAKPIPINIGTDEPITINDLAAKIISLSNKNIEIEYIDVLTTGVENRIPDLSKAKNLIDFDPKVSLDEGLEKTYRWVEKSCKF